MTTTLTALLFLRSTGGPLAAPSYTPQQAQTPPSSVIASGPTAVQPIPGAVGALPPPLPTRASEYQDPDFDLTLAASAGTPFPSGTELHAVGVYKGAAPAGQSEKPWWSNCTGAQNDSKAMQECHRKYASSSTTQDITVRLNSDRPMVLAVMSYETVNWKIEGAGSNLQQVILGGYKTQSITGIPPSVSVIVQTRDPSTCASCIRKGGYIYTYDEKNSEHVQAIAKLEALTGLALASFQGTHEEREFRVNGGAARTALAPRPQYVDQIFREELDLGGVPVMLPAGPWLGIFHQANPSTIGEDNLLVLAQIEEGKLHALLAVRARTNRQRQGFPTHQACDTIRGYLVDKDINESFGPQMCKWVTHVTTPWSQSVFAAGADKLNQLGIDVPELVIASGLHRAEMASSVTAVYYSNPESKGIRAPRATWAKSEWHPSKIDSSPQKRTFVDEQIEMTSIWYQVLRARRQF